VQVIHQYTYTKHTVHRYIVVANRESIGFLHKGQCLCKVTCVQVLHVMCVVKYTYIVCV